jgi:hypothetical protein
MMASRYAMLAMLLVMQFYYKGGGISVANIITQKLFNMIGIAYILIN